MVFPPVPAVYLDPHPPNWQQQQGVLGVGGCSSTSTTINNHHHQFSSMMMPPPPAIPTPPIGGVGNSTGGGGGGTGSVRPGSMAERARLAKIPQPETALKCPRCESTNTKFCYFNNYSLTQPRHFCKTCRRYWTRGGALRNVPVGGGCRRNKRSKRSSRSKSPQSTPPLPILITPSSSTNDHRRISTNTTTTTSTSAATTTIDLLPHNFPPPIPSPFFSPLDNLNSTIHHDQFGINADIGLNFHWKFNQQQLANFVSSSSTDGYGGSGGGVSGDQFEHGLGNYIGNLIESHHHHHHHKSSSSPSSALELEASHLASVLKLQEDNSNNHHHHHHQDMIITDHLSRNFSESSSQDHQYWTNTANNTGINNSWIMNLSAPSPATGHEHLI